MENIVFSMKEKKSRTDSVTYDDLLKEVEKEETAMDDFVAEELNYFENYTLKDLELIGGYYGLLRKRKKKKDYINDIVRYEKNIENEEEVFQRKLKWSYLQELLEDKYLSKFIVLN